MGLHNAGNFMIIMKIFDASDDETDDMEIEASETSSSISNDELTLPDGIFIVEKIVNHKSYGELRRKKLIDERKVSYNCPFFRVCWKGFPDQDTWEPFQSIQHVDAFKKYIRKHNLIHLIRSISNDKRSKKEEEREDSEVDDVKCPIKKSKIQINSETEKKKRFGHQKLFTPEKKHNVTYMSNYQNGRKKSKKDNKTTTPKSTRKYIEITSNGFTAPTKRTRSVSPTIEKVLRKQQLYDAIDDEEFRDDQSFLKRTKISAAIERSELAFIAKKLEEGCILRMFWIKIRNYNLRSPLRQICQAKACELDNILFKIIKQGKNFEKYYFRLRKCLIERNAIEFLKQLQNMKEWCISNNENFGAIIFALLTENEKISKFVQILSNNCRAPEHHRCRILEISLSCLSLKYRAKLFNRLNCETNHKLLDIVVGIACNGGGFCLLDTLIKYGINIGCIKIHALRQYVLNGNEKAISHLILNGFEVKHIRELRNDNLQEQTCKIINSINIYLDRLDLKIQCWTMELLRKHNTKFTYCSDAFPISNICLHRIGQIDRNVLVIHSLNLSSAESIMDIGIHEHHSPVQFRKHLQFHFGDHNNEINLICVLRNTNSCIYWFPYRYNDKIDTRVHVKLSYLPSEYMSKENNLIVLQLWNLQITRGLLLKLIEKAELKE
ncbi:Imidazolonepropionase [Dirofilaria immitis]